MFTESLSKRSPNTVTNASQAAHSDEPSISRVLVETGCTLFFTKPCSGAKKLIYCYDFINYNKCNGYHLLFTVLASSHTNNAIHATPGSVPI